MKNLLSKLKPVLKKRGVLYLDPSIKNTQKQIVLEDINKEAEFGDFLYNKGKVMGFKVNSAEVGLLYPRVVISKKIGDSGIHIIMDADESMKEVEPIGYATSMCSALNKAYKYILDKTTMGLKKFKKMNRTKLT
jgi:hypothetical protein